MYFPRGGVQSIFLVGRVESENGFVSEVEKSEFLWWVLMDAPGKEQDFGGTRMAVEIDIIVIIVSSWCDEDLEEKRGFWVISFEMGFKSLSKLVDNFSTVWKRVVLCPYPRFEIFAACPVF